MHDCSTCKWTGCLLSMPEIYSGECDRIYQKADNNTLRKRLKDKKYWPDKSAIIKALRESRVN